MWQKVRMENEGGGEEDEDGEKENYLEQANRIRARWWRGRTVEDDDKEGDEETRGRGWRIKDCDGL
jgi:hypothetical protein